MPTTSFTEAIAAAADDRIGPSRLLQPAWRAIAAEIGLSAGAFLDLCARNGWICIHVAAGKPELDAVGLVSPGRLRRAEHNRQRRLNCTFKALPPDALTYPDRTFTAALAVACADGWGDPTAVLAEVHRVLAPGGRLFVYDPLPEAPIPSGWLDPSGRPAEALVRSWLRRHALSETAWGSLKEAVRRSPFGGGEESQHGCFRRLVLTRSGS